MNEIPAKDVTDLYGILCEIKDLLIESNKPKPVKKYLKTKKPKEATPPPKKLPEYKSTAIQKLIQKKIDKAPKAVILSAKLVKEFKCTPKDLNNAFRRMIKMNLLQRIATGIYMKAGE